MGERNLGLTLYILLQLCLVGNSQIISSSRLVITFLTRADNLPTNPSLYNATAVKRYGRRLVLDLMRPFKLWEEEKLVKRAMLAVEKVEVDYLVGVADEQAYEDVPVQDEVVLQQAYFSGEVPPLTQWNLKDSESYSIHAEGVWLATNSTPNVVVAVIDTGLATPAREYFLNLVDGYDFISDADLALDWDGRDSDATDPGDWGDYCPTPSWHGTRVASIMAARHDNKFGMRGVAQNCSVMPVRVLGLCKMGYANDVTDAIVWAAGGTIDGIPPNPLPAKILSLSLAGQGECPSYLQSAIDLAVSLGSVVVTATGNNNKDVSGYFPANCKGVIAVAASTRQGTLAGYSNYGNLVTMSAPGGDYTDPIMTLKVNAMETDLLVAFGTGTSFAVPHVSGLFCLFRALKQTSIVYQNVSKMLNTSSVCRESNRCTRDIASMAIFNPLVFPAGQCSLGTYVVCGGMGWSYCGCTCPSNFVYHKYQISGSSTIFEACICAAGGYTPGSDPTVCVLCSNAGTYSYTDPIVPTSYGLLRPSSGCFQCPTCRSGFYMDGCSGGSSGYCLPCNECQNFPGTYLVGCSGTSGGTCLTCQNCEAGKYATQCTSSSVGTCTSCDSCPAGKYRSSCSGVSPGECKSCVPCDAGGYIVNCDDTSQGQCLSCPAGSYSTAGSFACTPCELGISYAANAGSAECLPCTGGSCIGNTRIVSCTIYANGFCEDCLKPSFSVYKSTCIWECIANYYKSGSSCSPCTTYDANPTAPTETRCNIGEYFRPCTLDTNGACVPCTNKPSNSQFSSFSSSGDNCAWICNAGYYKDSMSCRTCDQGTYSATAGRTTPCQACPLCETGKWNNACGGSSAGGGVDGCIACLNTF
jgi:hypothetical protein